MSLLSKILSPLRAPQISLVKPHSHKSRDVKDSDIERVKNDAQQMVILAGAMVMRKVVTEVFAISHPQVDTRDPLRFFTFCPQSKTVRDNINEIDRSMVIVNPRIVRHTEVAIQRDEGCVTFLGLPMVMTARFNKVEVEYQQLERNLISQKLTLTPFKHKSFSGVMAQIFQHEIDHFNCDYIHKNWKELKRTYYKI